MKTLYILAFLVLATVLPSCKKDTSGFPGHSNNTTHFSAQEEKLFGKWFLARSMRYARYTPGSTTGDSLVDMTLYHNDSTCYIEFLPKLFPYSIDHCGNGQIGGCDPSSIFLWMAPNMGEITHSLNGHMYDILKNTDDSLVLRTDAVSPGSGTVPVFGIFYYVRPHTATPVMNTTERLLVKNWIMYQEDNIDWKGNVISSQSVNNPSLYYWNTDSTWHNNGWTGTGQLGSDWFVEGNKLYGNMPYSIDTLTANTLVVTGMDKRYHFH